MDFTGTLLGALTIPMALLNAGCGIAGLWLILRGDWLAVAIGALLFLAAAIIAPLLSRTSKALAGLALTAKAQDRRALRYFAAICSGGWPVLIIIVWEVATLHLLLQRAPDGDDFALWLWSYGVATGVWSWQAHRASKEDRTLRGIQAYSAQLAYVILSAVMLLLGWPLPAAIALMLLPMILPLVVGMLLAIADRDALRDVQV
jgi:hypothetical protein